MFALTLAAAHLTANDLPVRHTLQALSISLNPEDAAFFKPINIRSKHRRISHLASDLKLEKNIDEKMPPKKV